MEINKKQLYKDTNELYGLGAQINQAIEECAELIVALRHFERRKSTRKEVVRELADVSIMVEQMVQSFSDKEEFRLEREFKIKRLKDRIDKLKNI
jgi:NTP pyrophosphatase (non-canonical NTP hydrolase)